MSEIDDSIDRIANYREQLEQAPGTWPAKRLLADSVRQLMDCLCATDAPEEELLAIAAQVQQSAERFQVQPRMTNLPGVAEGSLAGGMEMFMDRSPLVGRSNPLAPPVTLDPDHAAKVVRGSVYFGRAYEGAPGCVHGGFVAATFDEALGLACVFSGVPGMTGEITVRYRKPTPLEVPLRRASIARTVEKSTTRENSTPGTFSSPNQVEFSYQSRARNSKRFARPNSNARKNPRILSSLSP